MRLLAALLLAVALAGCGGGDEAAPTGPGTGTSPETTEPTTTDAEPTTLRVYFVRDERVGVAIRELEATEAVAAASLRALLEGPTAEERAAGLSTQVPSGTRLLGVTIADGIATIDLSEEFQSGGGSASMLARVAQVVYTATQFPTVERVAFRIEGEPVEAIGGEGVSVSPPVGRGDFEDQTPAILVESVAPGQEVSSPLRVTGTANTFEATLMLRIVDANGRELFDNFFTATSGSGTRGTFEATLTFDIETEGPGTLVAYESSAEDGSEIHVVRIPVELRRGS